jgi:hypothetical protein
MLHAAVQLIGGAGREYHVADAERLLKLLGELCGHEVAGELAITCPQ